MLTREFREMDLRKYYLKLREKTYTTDVTVTFNFIKIHCRMNFLE